MSGKQPYRGQVAVVTGGASGIGAALGREMGLRGAHVVLADRQVEAAEQVANSIRSQGGSASSIELDVREMSSWTRFTEDTVRRWGGIHFFFNNAGIAIGGEVEHYQPRDWDDVFDVNVRGVAYGIQAVYPIMIRQHAGHIINTASIAGLIAAPGETGYTASKHAVVGLSKALRVEAKHHGVRVTALCPGVIRTPILTGGKYGRSNSEGASDKDILSLWERLRPMDVEVFAPKVVAQLARNPAIIVVPSWWKVVWLIDRYAPALVERFADYSFTTLRKDLERFGARHVSQPTNGAPKRDASSQRKLV